MSRLVVLENIHATVRCFAHYCQNFEACNYQRECVCQRRQYIGCSKANYLQWHIKGVPRGIQSAQSESASHAIFSWLVGGSLLIFIAFAVCFHDTSTVGRLHRATKTKIWMWHGMRCVAGQQFSYYLSSLICFDKSKHQCLRCILFLCYTIWAHLPDNEFLHQLFSILWRRHNLKVVKSTWYWILSLLWTHLYIFLE